MFIGEDESVVHPWDPELVRHGFAFQFLYLQQGRITHLPPGSKSESVRQCGLGAREYEAGVGPSPPGVSE